MHEALINAGAVPQSDPAGATFQAVISNAAPDAQPAAEWVYALVAPFPTLTDDVTWADFSAYWTGQQASMPGFDSPPQLFITPDVMQVLAAKIGAPGPSVPVTLLTGDETAEAVADMIWDARPAISVVPFDQLQPRWKVLSIDGMNPLDKLLDTTVYPLAVKIGAVFASGSGGDHMREVVQQSGNWPATNRDISKMDTVVMTGVTALSRAVAKSMEVNGVDYAAEKIMPFLQSADILHTSNEASFDPDCPPQDWQGEPKFCEHRDTFQLFKDIGLDIVELTGNHNLDYGIGPALNSLDVYNAEGLPYFGGGRDITDATTPRILTGPSGTSYAFIGCNSAGPFHAWATDANPGAAPCEDWTRIKQQIADLKAQGNIVIVTVQYQELDQYNPNDAQRADFEALSLAGADIVSGSQAHQPQGFSFVDGKFVHFGLGNLFFDQVDYPENRQMFMDKHIFYDGRHISTILFTGWFENVAQARPMTADERRDLLERVFAASGW